jgi:hypothetical protein
MSFLLYLRRALVGTAQFFGGPVPSRAHGQPPPSHEPAVRHCGPEMPQNAIGKIPFADAEAGSNYTAIHAGKSAVGAPRGIENLDPVHRAILTAGTSKRNGPFVLNFAGGKA